MVQIQQVRCLLITSVSDFFDVLMNYDSRRLNTLTVVIDHYCQNWLSRGMSTGPSLCNQSVTRGEFWVIKKFPVDMGPLPLFSYERNLKDTRLVPVGIEFVPGFGLQSEPSSERSLDSHDVGSRFAVYWIQTVAMF